MPSRTYLLVGRSDVSSVVVPRAHVGTVPLTVRVRCYASLAGGPSFYDGSGLRAGSGSFVFRGMLFVLLSGVSACPVACSPA